MKILVINTGSSSIKYQIFNMSDESVLCSGLVEKIGVANEKVVFNHNKAGEKIVIEKNIPSHKEGMEEVVKLLLDEKVGVLKDVSEISGVGHRIVHGGDLSEPQKITPEIIEKLRNAVPLAPLHNPAGILGIEIAMDIFKGVEHVVVLDTAFHQTMPDSAFMYPLPYEYYEKFGVRKYGFHGTSHKYVTYKLAEILGKKPEEVNAITVHLGNGSSITAVKNGKSVDTSMGLTPLDGVMMGTRCGSIDPAVVGFLASNANMSVEEVDNVLTKKSGILGISGTSDLRNVLENVDKGDEKSKLALDMLCHRIKHYISAYLGGLGVMPDAIVFTAGIGENSSYVREHSLANMEYLGIDVDINKNTKKFEDYLEFNNNNSKIKLFAIRTNEELEIAKQTIELINK